MSTGVETKPTEFRHSTGTSFSLRWNWKKICLFTVFVFAAHLVLMYVFGIKKSIPPRIAENIPQLQFANAGNELIALQDPTLFAQPHIEDFVPAIWRKMPEVPQPSIHWTEPPPFLQPTTETLGAMFNTFMASNQFMRPPLDFKPSPILSSPKMQLLSVLPKNSSLRIEGALSQRSLASPANVPALAYNDIIAPSRVQVLVDAAGKVISAVLLPSESALENAGRADVGDTNALNIARGLRFTAGSGLTLGELFFDWHTLPVATTATNQP